MSLSTRLRRLFVTRPPAVSVEIAADRVTGLALGLGDPATVAAVATEPLPQGALVPAATNTNVVDRAAISDALTRMLQRLPGAPTRVALVLPDSAAKVSMMTFAQVPARAADLDQLVRWQARKTGPFKSEETQVAYAPGLATPEGGCEFVVSVMRRDIVQEYEAVCAAGGLHAGVVDLASFSQVNAILAGGAGNADWLLVHVAQGYSTLAVVRAGHMILFRNRLADGDDNLADLVHQTTMYYEDRLHGRGYQRVFLAASAAQTTRQDAAMLRQTLESRLGFAVESIDLPRRCTGEGGGGVLSDLLAAPLGLLLRERLAAATPA